ncbi:hypothetical protein ABS71_11740 [bacterium SCN 62-11]|nr:response regulator transcription factor [Candidatus Eremiobacteraeota bacterium]ODT66224.1 MAG: hypothetical protein ABS71_11740 [bacterium SCN 62-11]
MRILMVDDHELVRQGLKLLLEGEPGWTVIGECSSAAECLPAVEQLQPDITLVDLSLPDQPGLELVAALKLEFPQLPVLVLSSSEDMASVSGALRAGAGGYLVKSARRDEMIAAVRTVAQGGAYLHPRIASGVLNQFKSSNVLETPSLELSERERTIIHYVSQGLSNPEMAHKLHVSLGTIKNDLSQLFRKLDVQDRVQLIRESTRRGWLPTG